MSIDQTVDRDTPNPAESRASLVKQWVQSVLKAKDYWEPTFEKMRENMRFAKGKQWPGMDNDDKYVANIVQRHVRQREAALYAKDPVAVARVKPRLDFQVWDEDQNSLLQAMQNPQDPMSMSILQDAQEGVQRRKMLKKVGKTQEILFSHYLSEQQPPFKTRFKRAVNRTLVNGVSYVKLGYQRIMEQDPNVAAQIADVSQRLAHLERLSADLEDNEVDENGPESEELRLGLQALQSKPELIVREGLVFDFPKSTAVVIDPNCTEIRGFVGAKWIAQEFTFTPEEIQEIYGVDVGKQFNGWVKDRDGTTTRTTDGSKSDTQDMALVWEVYDKASGLMLTVCDGYPDFLEEPGDPNITIERFWPIYGLVFNDMESEEDGDLIPDSDVFMLKDAQLEYNRARQGLREQRQAGRPRYVSFKGAFDEDDSNLMADQEAHSVVFLGGLVPGEKVTDKLQRVPVANVDPGLYSTDHLLEDTLHVVGSQEANLGGTGGGTATESSIAESSRLSSVESSIDDLNDFLTDIARDAGIVMLTEVSPETAANIAGPGAVWPQLSQNELADEILLEVEAGSSGKPNKAQELANMDRVMPFLLQIPGINPTMLAKEALKRMDDRLVGDMAEWIIPGLASVTAQNQNNQAGTGDPETDPNQQGSQGGQNAEQAAQTNEGPQPAFPTQ